MPTGAGNAGPTILSSAQARFGSALVRGHVPLSVEEVEWNGASISIVMHKLPGGDAHPVAVMVADPSPSQSTRVLLMALALPDSVRPGPGLDVARDEHLYTLAFRQDADALYCVPSSSGGCEGGQYVSQGEALQRLASRRECALAALPDSLRAELPRWRTVTLSLGDALPGPSARVSARVSDQDVPIAGAQVMFSRLPHSACAATTSADGTATCELADAHGHGDGHPEFDRAPVLVTFPGDLRGNPILLPTTKRTHESGAPQGFRFR